MHSNFERNYYLSFVFFTQHALVNLNISILKLFLRDHKVGQQKLMSWFPLVALRCQHRRRQEACEVLLTGGDSKRRRSAGKMQC
ncbi:hypothetical protein S83_004869 [Arachis hypogaea]